MKKIEEMKKIATYAGIVLFLLVLSYAFVPQVLGGKIVNQSDISGWQGMARETLDWNAAHPDDKTRWTDSMFGGMPNVTVQDDFDGDWTKPLYKALLWGKRPASYLFLALLGGFLMMLAMGVNRFLAVIGAIAVAFCAYNFQIIQVGHNTKMQAIAFAPWAIAALIFTYRSAFREGDSKAGGKPLLAGWLPSTVLGTVLFGLALSFQIKANHVQITYYLALVIFIYVIATFVWVLKRENRALLGRFFIASALLLAIGITGIATNANKLIPTYAYTPYTMRGGSELTKEGTNDNGLSLDYATAWSYGIEETPNLMIPNYNGGSSNGSLGEKSAMWQLLRQAGQNPKQICQNLPLYWGPQPFTAGPMYMGAISIFLFILGMCVLKGREKWWLLASCVLAILLGWGRNFMWFTQLWFDYAPFYNKFRTVSMAIVIVQFCMPLLGIYALDRIIREDIPHRDVVRGVWISLGVTAGFCAIAALFPSIAGDFISPSDAGYQPQVLKALQYDRRHLLQADAWRSFLLIVFSAAVLVWSYMKNDTVICGKRIRIAAAIIGVLVLFDLWGVGKRYLNSSDFITPKDFSAHFNARPVDKAILEDKSPSYRVLDLSENTFNSSLTSYRHKSIGGYSPTKMQRYQDLIDHYLEKEIKSFYSAASEAATLEGIQNALPYMPAVSMLNGKYIIIGGEYPPVENRYAFGPAWTVSSVKTVGSADEEIAALGQVDLHRVAVVREGDCSGVEAATEGAASITMTSYAPNELHYTYSSTEPVTAVFSEIYHPSWKATLDGKPIDLFRADWVLRAAELPAGSGEIVMRYEPQDYVVGEAVSRASSILLLLLLVGSVLFGVFGRRK